MAEMILDGGWREDGRNFEQKLSELIANLGISARDV
jgi:hypothetical protein